MTNHRTCNRRTKAETSTITDRQESATFQWPNGFGISKVLQPNFKLLWGEMKQNVSC